MKFFEWNNKGFIECDVFAELSKEEYKILGVSACEFFDSEIVKQGLVQAAAMLFSVFFQKFHHLLANVTFGYINDVFEREVIFIGYKIKI